LGKKARIKKSEVELEEIKEYAAEDADVTFQLNNFSVELEKTETKKLLKRLKFLW
jgi:DNA polymerase-1